MARQIRDNEINWRDLYDGNILCGEKISIILNSLQDQIDNLKNKELKEFEKNFIKKSNITQDYYNKYYRTLPCKCDAENCKGWAAVSKDEMTIKLHNKLYG